MHARSLAALGATLLALACSTDDPTTPSAPTVATGIARTEKLPAPSTSGILSVCQASGAGLPAGQSFTSSITLAGVTRSLTNATGDCARLEVPRESTPQGKGWFQSRPTEVERLLPSATSLAIDGANLARADLLAILGAAPNVQVSSTLLLNLAQQLIAAELNVLRGVQATPQVNQVIVDANAGLRITRGSQIAIGTSLSNPQVSALVTALTAFNEAKTKPAASSLSVDVDIVQAAVRNLEVASIGCEPLISCSGGNLLLGRITTTVKSGVTTIVTYTNQSKPILRVCVVAGTGVTTGTVSHFDAWEVGLTPLAFDVPAGECREAETDASVEYDLTETRAAGVGVGSIVCDPTTHCTFFSLESRSVSPFMDRGVTTVTFTNRTTLGTLKICKIAGVGIAAGRLFNISAENLWLVPIPGELIVADAKVPAGDCVEKTLLEGDDYEVREFEDFIGFKVSSITCEPALRCGGSDLDRHSILADVVGGSTTTVHFTNRTTLGTIKVCVGQFAGVPAGSSFLIDVSPYDVAANPAEPSAASPTVAVGACQEATLKEGTYTVSESLFGPGYSVESIVCNPTDRCTGAFGTNVKAQIIAGSTTQVTFTNSFASSRVVGLGRGSVRSP